MGNRVIFYGWNRSIPGREQVSAAHFQEYIGYLNGLQESGAIDSWEVIFLAPHGGDLNGFFLIRGNQEQLSALQASEEYLTHVTRGSLHLEGSGAIRGSTGEAVMEEFGRWMANIPQ
ncbi:MAG: hypothetical protein R3293_14605 [Candidatus Promineifilaceae bacterium]|nr:hypothetical protein [Candidatus Promineifilaceae bacterium]